MGNISYNFTPQTIQSEKIISVRLDTKILDITDEITDIRKRLNDIEAAELANCAAGVVVGKIGTATCSGKELLEFTRDLRR